MTRNTILFLAASPYGTDQRTPGREASSIHRELERSGYRERFELVTRWAAEPLDLLRELRSLKPAVVHFSGHGGEGGLVFQSVNGDAQMVPSEAVAETFGAAGISVKLVVLSACNSDAPAKALLAHVDCVVGTSGALPDDMARAFAIGFYGGLGEYQSIAAAYRQGNAAISLVGLLDLDRPWLRVRDGVDAAKLVLAAAASAVPLALPRLYRRTQPNTGAPASAGHAAMSGSDHDYELRIDLERLGSRYLAVARLYNQWFDEVEPRIESPVDLPDAALHDDVEGEGTALAQALFGRGAFIDRVLAARERAERNEGRLHVRLLGPSDRSMILRWEALLDPRSEPAERLRLFTGQRVSFARSIAIGTDPEQRRQHSERQQDLRRTIRSTRDACALVAIAAPHTTALAHEGWPNTQIDRAAHVALATRALKDFRLMVLPGPTSVEALRDALAQGTYDILYLLCHAQLRKDTGSALLFEDADGNASPIPSEWLVSTIRGLDHRPSLMFLASCESGSMSSGRGGLIPLGPRLIGSAGVPAVVAMMDRVELATATDFAKSFFHELSTSGKVMPAVSMGRSAIQTRRDWWAPVLYTLADVDRLFERDQPGEDAWAAVELASPKSLDAMKRERPEIDAELYVSRDLEFEVKNFLDGPHSAMVITGQSGMGKTTLVAQLLRERFKQGDLCFFVPSQQLPAKIKGAQVALMQALVDLDMNPREFWQAIDRECSRRGRRLIVAIDAINEFNRQRELDEDRNEPTPLQFLGVVDELARNLGDAKLEHVKLIVTSRPEVWRRGVDIGRVRMRSAHDAYHVTQQAIDHVLDRYTENEAVRAFHRYAGAFRIKTAHSELPPLVQFHLRDPLLLRLTCEAFHNLELPGDLDSTEVFARYDNHLRRQPRGPELLATLDKLAAAMFDGTGTVIQRDAIRVDGKLQREHPDLFQDLTGALGDALRDDHNVISEDRRFVRFTYDRYAEYRLSSLLMAAIEERRHQGKRRRSTAIAIDVIRKNLRTSFQLTTVFRALRRTLRQLAPREQDFLSILCDLTQDEHGLPLVVSVLAAVAMRSSAADNGLVVVNRVLDDMKGRIDRGQGVQIPIIDIAYRMLLDEEYAAWLRRRPELGNTHHAVLDELFEWGFRHKNLEVSTAAVQYLFFLWRNPAGRSHAERITEALVAKVPALWKLVHGPNYELVKNLCGAFMLALAEAHSDAEAKPILRLGRAIFLGLKPHQSKVAAVIRKLPVQLRRFMVSQVLKANTNPVNYTTLTTLYGNPHLHIEARKCIALIRDADSWCGQSLDTLLPLANTVNGFVLEMFCFALSVRWESLAIRGDTAALSTHLELLRALFAAGSPSAQYGLALALYHINYFGDHGTTNTIEVMRTMVERVLGGDGRGRFSFAGDDRVYDTNVIGTFGRVLQRYDDQLVGPRAIAKKPILAFVLDILTAAKRESRTDDYRYVCESIGLLGTLAHPRHVFDIIAHILVDLCPESFGRDVALEAPEVPIPDQWTIKERTELLDTVTIGLANIRVLYRAEVDRWILDVLDDQALYTRVATQVQPDFHLATFYSWTFEHLMYRMLTRYAAQVGDAYLEALVGATEIGDGHQAVEHVLAGVLNCLQQLVTAQKSTKQDRQHKDKLKPRDKNKNKET